jgi:membrane peptidoglycan carboxypeptidase
LGLPFDRARWKSERAYEAECRESSLWRKVKEAAYALALESRFSKDEILTIYINRSFLGAGARGFEAAAQRYFGKSARNVNPAEAAMLAGLLVAPTRYAPTNNLQRSQNRAGVIINLMQAQALLSAEEADFARKNPAQLSQAAKANAGNYFADWVMQSGPRFLTQTTTEDVIIKTTFDRRLQNAAEQAMHQVFDSKVRPGSKAQAAIVVMSPNGAVRAMLGGRNTSVAGGFNRATQALRQTGSAFKPFVYAAALEAGYSPYDILQDSPLTLDLPGSGPWSPQNYSKEFLGPVSLNAALSQSLNIPTIRLSEEVGRDVVRNVASGFGVGEKLATGPALALGVSEATLIDMVGAYAGILNRGLSVTPFGLNELRLFGDDTALMGATNSAGQRVISPTAAHNLIFMMQNVMVEGTGQKAAIEGWQTAGKTGTTQSARDAWFIGFSSDYVIGVWMGYDDNTPLTGVTGGGLPAEIWKATMLRAQGDLPPNTLVQTAQTRAGAGKTSRTTDRGQGTNAINRFLRNLFGQN